MGLDMYLNVSERISSHDYNRNNYNEATYTENPRYAKVMEAIDTKVKDNIASSVSVEWTAIYWRKANQIHNWFVNTLADGVDECQVIPVPRENLVALHDRCSVLLDTKSDELAADLLPPVSGFFFGSTTIDEWYWQDVEETHKQLTELLDEITKENEWNYTIEYQASW
jgi:hypothetical protein